MYLRGLPNLLDTPKAFASKLTAYLLLANQLFLLIDDSVQLLGSPSLAPVFTRHVFILLQGMRSNC